MSCSYVAPSAQTCAVSDNLGGSGLCIVEIALAEEGTTETGEN
jgi:hypothetical protein